MFEIAYGGEGRYTTSLGSWLVNKNHDVTVMGSSFSNVKAQRLSKNTIQAEHTVLSEESIKTLNPPYAIYSISRMFLVVLWILKIFSLNSKYPITVIHAQDTGYAGLAAVISGKILRIPVLVSSHGIRHKSLEIIIGGRLKKLLLKAEYSIDIFVVKNAQMVLAINSDIKNYFEKIISKTVEFIPIPIKLENFQFSLQNRDKMRETLGINKEADVIGFIGRFSPEKNLQTLLISFANLVKHHPSTKLILVGTGPLSSQLEGYIRQVDIEDKVIFTGVRYDIEKILSGFDIFVLPSYIEGLSTSLLEAMSCGRAIICSNIPANRELVNHNIEALLFDPYKHEDLEMAMELLCNDDGLRSKLGHNAKLRTRQYDEDVIFSRILQCYRSLRRQKKK